ncbi:hypothetical protein ACT4UM_14860, partial [Bacillus sp. SS-TM]
MDRIIDCLAEFKWDESDLKQRNIIAVDEHMTILSALICRSDLDATLALRNHLNSAKQSMKPITAFIFSRCASVTWNILAPPLH